MSRRLASDENGYATLAGAGAIAAIAAVIVLVIYLGAAVVARHRAQSAADLTALAAAIDHVAGEADPCAAARALAAQQTPAVRVDGCEVRAEDIVVRIRVDVDLGPLGARSAFAAARAGPVE
ncbi:hypothetical protein GCM10009624_30080 [Gordonia sinesedis]